MCLWRKVFEKRLRQVVFTLKFYCPVPCIPRVYAIRFLWAAGCHLICRWFLAMTFAVSTSRTPTWVQAALHTTPNLLWKESCRQSTRALSVSISCPHFAQGFQQSSFPSKWHESANKDPLTASAHWKEKHGMLKPQPYLGLTNSWTVKKPQWRNVHQISNCLWLFSYQ